MLPSGTTVDLTGRSVMVLRAADYSVGRPAGQDGLMRPGGLRHGDQGQREVSRPAAMVTAGINPGASSGAYTS